MVILSWLIWGVTFAAIVFAASLRPVEFFSELGWTGALMFLASTIYFTRRVRSLGAWMGGSDVDEDSNIGAKIYSDLCGIFVYSFGLWVLYFR